MNIFECEIEKNFQLYVIFKPFCGKKKKNWNSTEEDFWFTDDKEEKKNRVPLSLFRKMYSKERKSWYRAVAVILWH